MKPNFIFFGTPAFAATVLEKLLAAKLIPEAVVTAPDKPVGRHQVLTPSPVKLLAQKHGIAVLTPKKLDRDFIHSQYTLLQTQFHILAAYGRIIPKELLALPTQGSLNIHPSLLPKYRGPSPVQTVILNGDQETGVSIILMDEEIDHGPILTQEKLSITPEDTYETLSQKLAELSASLIIRSIEPYLKHLDEGAKSSFVTSLSEVDASTEFDDTKSGERPSLKLNIKLFLPPIEQDHRQATYTKILTRQDGYFDLDNPPENLKNMLRALHPWPGVWTRAKIGNKELKIKLLPKNLLLVAGKKPVSLGEFFRGYPSLKPQLEQLTALLV